MRAWWASESRNVGDTLTPHILRHFTGREPELVGDREPGRVLVCGSQLEFVGDGDTVVGMGSNNPGYVCEADARFLAVRGPLTASQVSGAEITTYGDPALLLPLMYAPKVEKQHEVGTIPHYVDKVTANVDHLIDIESYWQVVVREILSCERVVSSSLHGIVIAEAYSIPAQWAVWSGQIAGGGYKFQDYFLGTGRECQGIFADLPPIPDLKSIQAGLIRALEHVPR